MKILLIECFKIITSPKSVYPLNKITEVLVKLWELGKISWELPYNQRHQELIH